MEVSATLNTVNQFYQQCYFFIRSAITIYSINRKKIPIHCSHVLPPVPSRHVLFWRQFCGKKQEMHFDWLSAKDVKEFYTQHKNYPNYNPYNTDDMKMGIFS